MSAFPSINNFLPGGQLSMSFAPTGYHQPYSDAQTLAYYQNYYAQMGYSYPATFPPNAVAGNAYYPMPGVPSHPPSNDSNPTSSLHPLLQHQSNTAAAIPAVSSFESKQKSHNFAGSTKQDKRQQQQSSIEAVEDEPVDDDGDPTIDRGSSGHQNKRNVLSIHGNEKTMNLNTLLLTNIQQSQYFRSTLYGIKTVQELLDEIWNNVRHMEPWERGSRNVSVHLFFRVLHSL